MQLIIWVSYLVKIVPSFGILLSAITNPEVQSDTLRGVTGAESKDSRNARTVKYMRSSAIQIPKMDSTVTGYS